MIQLNIIRIRGQCRGRPLIRGDSRDGPEGVDSWRLTVDGLESSVVSQPFAVGRWPLAVGSWPVGQLAVGQFAVDRWPLAVGRWPLAVGFLEPWNPGTMEQSSVCALESGIWNLEFGSQSQHARDWITITCSVNSHITQNRRKHRSGIFISPAERRQDGRSTSGSDWGIWGLENWNLGTLELWNSGTLEQ